MPDDNYNEIYRKAEEKFFEDLKHYRTVVIEDILSLKQLRQYTQIKAIINKRLKEEVLSIEQIKSYEYANSRNEKERAKKKDKIF